MSERLEDVKIICANEAYQKVLYWFFSFPYKEISLSKLAKELKISKTSANRAIRLLAKEEFLNKKIVGKSWLISCNKIHKYNRTKKIVYNLSMIFNSNIIDIIQRKFKGAKSIILFGSYRKGDDIESSDIDVAVEVLGEESFRIEELGVIKNFGFRKNVLVNLHIFSRKSINLNLFSNIANGLILDGFLEVER